MTFCLMWDHGRGCAAQVSVPVTLNCAGNRRKEQNLIRKGIGFNWGCGAASTSVWTGVPLHEVLKHCAIKVFWQHQDILVKIF